jgi:hypothetical protein
MSAVNSTTPAAGAEQLVPDQARELAARLCELFEHDCVIVARLNDAHRRHSEANERLWCGLHPDALALIHNEAAPAGRSQIAGLISSAGDPEAAVLCALQQAHWQIHYGFHQYQTACEERRQLAVEVGELSQQLTEVLICAGFSAKDARNADVHQLAAGVWRAAVGGEAGR